MLRQLTFAALLCLCPSVLSASERAVLHARGEVNVNGSRVSATSTVTSGDVVAVRNGSGAISQPGVMVVLAANSSVEYRDGSLRLMCGLLTVTTKSGTPVQAAGVTAWPAADGKNSFRVQVQAATVHVFALTGAVWANGGGDDLKLLPKGEAVSFRSSGANGCKP